MDPDGFGTGWGGILQSGTMPLFCKSQVSLKSWPSSPEASSQGIQVPRQVPKARKSRGKFPRQESQDRQFPSQVASQVPCQDTQDPT